MKFTIIITCVRTKSTATFTIIGSNNLDEFIESFYEDSLKAKHNVERMAAKGNELYSYRSHNIEKDFELLKVYAGK